MLYTIKEAAAILRSSNWTVRQKIHAGELSCIKLGPRTFRITPEALQDYLNRHTALAAPPVSPFVPAAAPTGANSAPSQPAGPSPAPAASRA